MNIEHTLNQLSFDMLPELLTIVIYLVTMSQAEIAQMSKGLSTCEAEGTG